MYILTAALTGSLLAGTATAQRADGQFWPCNPIKNATGACPPDPGLPTSTYSIDFTKQTSIPANWTISNYASIPFGPNGAEFTFAKRYDAPQLWTDFFILFGKVTLTARIANGTGIISSFVLISDDFDEIDFEFSGNNFGDKASQGKGQNNYFGKGITGNYDRGGWFDVEDPQGSWHEYAVEWTEEKIVWSVDGRVVRTFLARDGTTAKGSAYQFPQTPSKFQLGIWAGGDPGMNEGTKSWAGGETNISAAPYTMYVKNVKIENYKPAWAYNWTDQSGTWQSIQLLQGPGEEESNEMGTSPTSSSSRAPSSSSSTLDYHSAKLFIKHDEACLLNIEVNLCFIELKANLCSIKLKVNFFLRAAKYEQQEFDVDKTIQHDRTIYQYHFKEANHQHNHI
ncbi:hypothetical protein PRZ48_003289 [Zasmidium cellare]|uniref:GH16 domain-containing protein n=1 Tax=Zasmidium cellare TaxID=395010 RepID=A0ABR0EW52_ZASCE|nr:hypothetical protein PRZ48_003289 [Zasmidium cellare]